MLALFKFKLKHLREVVDCALENALNRVKSTLLRARIEWVNGAYPMTLTIDVRVGILEPALSVTDCTNLRRLLILDALLSVVADLYIRLVMIGMLGVCHVVQCHSLLNQLDCLGHVGCTTLWKETHHEHVLHAGPVSPYLG